MYFLKSATFAKKHEFTIKYVIFSPIVSFLPAIIFDTMTAFWIFIAIAVVVYIIILLAYKSDVNDFYDDNRYTVNSIFVYSVIVNVISIFFESRVIAAIGTIAIAVICIYMRISYRSRIFNYAFTYIHNIENGTDKQNNLTDVSFFSQKKVIGFLAERAHVDGISSYNYIQDIFRECVLISLKKYFCNELSENNDRIFFFYEYSSYIPYLYEHNMDLLDTLSSFEIINSDFLYIKNKETGDGVFFSDNIFDKIIQNVMQFLKENPKLSDVPFSKNYLFNSMYNNGLLNPYIPEVNLELLQEDPELYEGDFLELYSGITNEGIQFALNNEQIKPGPKQNKKDEDTFILIHENEDGIIEKEYGFESEMHRATLDNELSSEEMNELKGCPV